MSVEDLEIHQPKEAPANGQFLQPRTSVVDGFDDFLQKTNGSVNSETRVYLTDVLFHPNERDETDEHDTDAVSDREQQNALLPPEQKY